MLKNLTIAAFFGFTALILGAFGAHALKETLSPDQLDSFETAVRYQMYHTLLLLLVNIFQDFSEKQKNAISYLLFTGLLLFSGSIYCIQLTPITAKSIWFVTPLGGLFLILGWSLIFIIFLKKAVKKTKRLQKLSSKQSSLKIFLNFVSY